jgi:hypothetical protein
MLGLLALLAPAHAFAAGGKSIATAPPVTYGQQEFGNTAEDQYLEESCGFEIAAWRSYWNLPVTAGDLLTIDWEGTRGTEIKLVPVGTTDYTLFQVDPVVSEELPSSGRSQVQYTVPLSGVMPLYFRTCTYSWDTPGPYNFIVTAQHSLSIGLASQTNIQTNSVISGSARLASGAPVPDGMSFTLTAAWPDGNASYTAASVGGGLSFQLALPESTEGQAVALTMSRAADSEYLEAKSGELTAKVAKPHPAPITPVTHKPLKCRKHFRKRRVHGRAKCMRVKVRAHRQRHGHRQHR